MRYGSRQYDAGLAVFTATFEPRTRAALTSSWTTAGEAVVIVPSISKASAEGFGFRRGSGWLIVVALRGARFPDVLAARNCSQERCTLTQACTATLRVFLQRQSKQHGRVALF